MTREAIKAPPVQTRKTAFVRREEIVWLASGEFGRCGLCARHALLGTARSRLSKKGR